MEGVIQYRLLGDHPAASGRYLTLGFPGEATTRDKIVEQVIQEHRINTSRYKLEVRKLLSVRDSPGGKHGSPSSSPPPPSAAGNVASNNAGSPDESGMTGGSASSCDAVVPVVLHENEELHTYDRLTITVSQRQLADDDATRKEQEQLERQRRVREMEEELLAPTHSGLPPHTTQNRATQNNRMSPLPSSTSGQPQDSSGLAGRGGGAAAAAAVDPLRLQRAAALASQLFPIMKGQHSNLTGIHDPANTHQCALCHLPAFEEKITSCCDFCVCSSCYLSAAEMDMEEGACPVCGTTNAVVQRGGSSGASADEHTSLGCDGSHKRVRGKEEGANSLNSPVGWKRERADESKDALQRSLRLGEAMNGTPRRDSVGGRGASSAAAAVAQNKRDYIASPNGSSAVASEEALQIEERLRQDLEKALALLDGPDTLSAAAKAKRVIGAELAALCEQ